MNKKRTTLFIICALFIISTIPVPVASQTTDSSDVYRFVFRTTANVTRLGEVLLNSEHSYSVEIKTNTSAQFLIAGSGGGSYCVVEPDIVFNKHIYPKNDGYYNISVRTDEYPTRGYFLITVDEHRVSPTPPSLQVQKIINPISYVIFGAIGIAMVCILINKLLVRYNE